MVGFDWMMNQIFTHRKWWFNHSIHLKLVVWASRSLFHPEKKNNVSFGVVSSKTVLKLWLINQPSPKRTPHLRKEGRMNGWLLSTVDFS